MRNLKPATVVFAFAVLSFVSATTLTNVTGHSDRKQAGEAELMTLATTKPVIIEDRALPLAGDHIESRKLVLAAMSAETDAKLPLAQSERPLVRMSKPFVMADATPSPAASSKSAKATVVNKSAAQQTIAVDSGDKEKVYTLAPGASVALDDCDKGCTATGPWGFSRSIKAGEVVETTGVSLVTTTKTKAASATTKTTSKAKAGKAKHKAASKAKHAAKKPNLYFKGSFRSLFTGIVHE